MKTFFISIILLAATTSVAAVNSGVRLKNFREIYYSLAALTTIDENDADMKTVFNLVKDRLPRAGSPQEFNSPSLMALTELSGAFCQKAVQKEKRMSPGERTLFPDVNFQRGPVQFSSYLSEVIAKRLSRIFWQREAKASEIAMIEQLILETAKDDMSTLTETEKVLQSVCTNFASSLAFATK